MSVYDGLEIFYDAQMMLTGGWHDQRDITGSDFVGNALKSRCTRAAEPMVYFRVAQAVAARKRRVPAYRPKACGNKTDTVEPGFRLAPVEPEPDADKPACSESEMLAIIHHAPCP
ncbi:MAG: hypothetical protein AAF250_14480 [Pseudomonadota bacterium]